MIAWSSSFLVGKTKLLGLGKRKTGKLDFSTAKTFKNSLIMIVWMARLYQRKLEPGALKPNVLFRGPCNLAK